MTPYYMERKSAGWHVDIESIAPYFMQISLKLHQLNNTTLVKGIKLFFFRKIFTHVSYRVDTMAGEGLQMQAYPNIVILKYSLSAKYHWFIKVNGTLVFHCKFIEKSPNSFEIQFLCSNIYSYVFSNIRYPKHHVINKYRMNEMRHYFIKFIYLKLKYMIIEIKIFITLTRSHNRYINFHCYVFFPNDKIARQKRMDT